MGINCKWGRIAVASAAVLGWVGVVVLMVSDVTRPHGSLIPPGWMAGMIIASSVAAAGSVASLMLCVLPSLYSSWRAGLEYGRDVEALDHERQMAREAPATTRLRSVK